MAVQTPPYALQNSSHGAQLFRNASSSWLSPPLPGTLSDSSWSRTTGSGSSTFPGGVVNTADMTVTVTGSNLSVTVAGGQVWMPGTNSSNQGLYYGLNDAAFTITGLVSNVTNPTVYLICATVNDAAYSGATNNWVLQAVAGTPTASATIGASGNYSGAPAIPNNSVPLCWVLVPANTSSIPNSTNNVYNVQPYLSPGASGLTVRGLPSGRIFGPGGTPYGSTGVATVPMTTSTPTYLRGGMTAASNALIVPVTGWYRVSAANGFSGGSSAGIVNTQIGVNATLTSYIQSAYNSAGTIVLASDTVFVVAGQAITMAAEQTSGSTLNNLGGTTQCWLTATLDTI